MASTERRHLPFIPLVKRIHFQVIPRHDPHSPALKLFPSNRRLDNRLAALRIQRTAGQEAARNEVEDGRIGASEIGARGGGVDRWMGLVVVFALSGIREF